MDPAASSSRSSTADSDHTGVGSVTSSYTKEDGLYVLTTTQQLQPATTSRDVDVALEPPDGGRDAWLVVLGSALAMFSTFGIVNAYGVFQSYYTTNLLSETSSSTISLIGALQLFFIYGLGPVMGRVFDAHGGKILFPVGTAVVFVSLILASFCQRNQAYQFLLSQGVLFGIGNSIMFTPGLAIVGQWFKRKRAYALGIVSAGSASGGVVFPVMVQRLIVIVGFPWTVRILALCTLACLTVSCLTLRTRLPLSHKLSLRGAVDLEGFRVTQYRLTALSSFLIFYAMFIPPFYIEVYANYHNVPTTLAKYLVSIVNISSIPGRLVTGWLAGRIGVLEVVVPSTMLCGIFAFATWLPAQGSAMIVAFAVLYGVFSGAFVGLLAGYIATISPVEKLGARTGTIYIFGGIAALVGTPTAGAFVPTFTQHNFNNLIIFTGILLIAGSSILGWACLLTHRQRRRTLQRIDSQPEEKSQAP